MAKLNDAKGRKDGGYTRIFGDEQIGQLISRIHSTSVDAGNELEKIIIQHAEDIGALETDLDCLLENAATHSGVKLIAKKHLKSTPWFSDQGSAPDFVVFDIDQNRFIVLEVTDGDTFDTKRVRPEIGGFNAFRQQLQSRTDLPVSLRICAFNQDDKERIVAGYKSDITLGQAMTGRELCALLRINYQELVDMRAKDAPENLDVFVHEILAIHSVREKIETELHQPKA